MATWSVLSEPPSRQDSIYSAYAMAPGAGEAGLLCPQGKGRLHLFSLLQLWGALGLQECLLIPSQNPEKAVTEERSAWEDGSGVSSDHLAYRPWQLTKQFLLS